MRTARLAPTITARGTTAISLADAKVFLEVSSGTHPHDDLITALIATAQAYVEERTGRFLEAATGEIYVSEYCQKIQIPRTKVASVVVTYYDEDNAEQTVDGSNYTLVRDAVFTTLRFYDAYTQPAMYDRPDAMKVVITFAADPVYPSIMLHAMRSLIADWYENRENMTIRADNVGTTGLNNRADHLLNVARIWGY